MIKQTKQSNMLIEEFMLLANKKVAEYVHELKQTDPRNTMVYRIHEAPDPEKLRVFSSFAKKFGYQVTTEPKQVSQSFNVKGLPEKLEVDPRKENLSFFLEYIKHHES